LGRVNAGKTITIEQIDEPKPEAAEE